MLHIYKAEQGFRGTIVICTRGLACKDKDRPTKSHSHSHSMLINIVLLIVTVTVTIIVAYFPQRGLQGIGQFQITLFQRVVSIHKPTPTTTLPTTTLTTTTIFTTTTAATATAATTAAATATIVAVGGATMNSMYHDRTLR